MAYFRKILAAVVAILLAGSVQSSDISLKAQQAQVLAYQASTGFHLLTVLFGDEEQQEHIETVLQDLELSISALSSELEEPERQSLLHRYNAFAVKMQSNGYQEDGFTSTLQVNDMESALERLQDSLHAFSAGAADPYLSASVQLNKATSRYARLAAHWNGSTMVAADKEGDTVDIHADSVAQQLNNFLAAATTPRERQEIKKVLYLWNNLEPRFVDYNRDLVPYFAAKHSLVITDKLESIRLNHNQ
ncbi:hypothetical protein [Parendozoicomonas sp. Alg238-R29]|uniref:hypothetical protein n=1 Tax=Parendozoicomonas sp. Alg238-R29 TaxID=2993446 RepID=UPI00248D6430|nr:hypothetical protein [Parendozoicomonas sp. Alg238-R29]